MKKHRLIFILPLLLILLTTASYFYNHMVYSSVEIQFKSNDIYKADLTPIEIQSLASALKDMGASMTFPQDDSLYQISLKHPFFGADAFKIIKIDEMGVLIESNGLFYQSNDAEYFFTASIFEEIYDAKGLPKANLTMQSNDMPATSDVTELTSDLDDWQIQKYDHNWYSISPSESVISKVFEINDANTMMTLTLDKIPDEVLLTYEAPNSNALIISNLSFSNGGYSIPSPDVDGRYVYHITANWTDDAKGYKGSQKYNFEVQYERPTEYVFDSLQIEQGQPLIITAKYLNSDERPSMTQDIADDFPAYFVPDGAFYKCYLPTNYDTKIGDYNVVIDDQTYEIKIISRAFNVQHLIIDQSVATSTRNDAAYIEFDEKFDPIRMSSAKTILSEGDFILPVVGRLSTEFGETRDINGSPTTYRHSGWDIAAPKGTPILASNSGTIVFSEPLILTGNTVVIDHGGGIFSIYFHMDSLALTAGTYVNKGDNIGTVGTTGFSTGPHLHFIISWYDHNLEPGWFLFHDSVTYENYKTYFK